MVCNCVYCNQSNFETIFFGQLKRPCHASGFWDFAFCVARKGKTPVYRYHRVLNNIKSLFVVFCGYKYMKLDVAERKRLADSCKCLSISQMDADLRL